MLSSPVQNDHEIGSGKAQAAGSKIQHVFPVEVGQSGVAEAVYSDALAGTAR